MRRRYRIAVLGGTFDRLHVGHRALLRAAFAAAEEVRIGITTSDYLARHPKPLAERIAPYARRRKVLGDFLRRKYAGRRWRMVPLRDGFGGSVLPGPDLLVVSASSLAGGRAVNRERRRRGLAPLALHVVPLVRDRDGRVVSSRRLRRAEVSRRDPAPRLARRRPKA